MNILDAPCNCHEPRHRTGSRNCIMCECANCKRNHQRPMWDLMDNGFYPCLNRDEGVSYQAVVDEIPGLITSRAGK
jgi:hypothetical protein